MTEQAPKVADPRLWFYQIAAGAGAIGAPALAAELPFNPPGGLPIVVDTTNILSNPVDVDLDGDAEFDFRFFYSTDYGGGFAISSNFAQVFEERGRVQATRNVSAITLVHRNDATEYVHVGNGTNYAPDFQTAFTSPDSTLDHAADAVQGIAAYTPFRDRPGYVAVSVGLRPGGIGYAGQFLISVNNSGDQLTIHSGSYRDDQYDLRLGDILEDGFENDGGAYFPTPPTPLEQLARGVDFGSTGEQQ